MNHIMVDIETMGTAPYSAIVSIAAVFFNPETGETGKAFHERISLTSCRTMGLTVDAQTIIWWLQKSDEARREIYEPGQMNIAEALARFSDFVGTDNYLWGNAASFDLSLLDNAFEKVMGVSAPWDFKKEMCLRTLVALKPEIKAAHEYKGTAHNPLDDCYNQIEYCSKTWRAVSANKSDAIRKELSELIDKLTADGYPEPRFEKITIRKNRNVGKK